MAISVQEVINRIQSTLDAEGSSRYTFSRDYREAINGSVEWIVSIFNKALSERKLTEENLSELTKVSVFQTNNLSRFKMDPADTGYNVWSILAVILETENLPDNSITPVATDFISLFRPDLHFVNGEHTAKRLTAEEWEENKRNVFSAGNVLLSNSLKEYAYLNFNDYSSSVSTEGVEIEIRPSYNSKLLAVRTLVYPDPITTINDTIPLPNTLINLVTEKALNIISKKQGDGTNLYSVTSQDILTLVKLMS